MDKDILYPLRKLHGMIHEEQIRVSYRRQLRSYFKKNPKTVFLVMTPEHGNLGDHAIASAELTLLQQAGINYIEITGKQLNDLRWNNLLEIMDGYPILFQGGGYLGTLWFNSEKCLREIIIKNKKSNIIFLPNTIFYENSDFGKQEFQNSVRIYNHHKNLHFYAREKKSFDIMSNAYQNVKLMPDMVLSLNKCGEHQPRHGCLLCLRGDHERTRTEVQDTLLRKQIIELFSNNVAEADMVVPYDIPPAQREEALSKQFSAFSQAELVITDRLHGMIFCAITGTPCIVINSKSPKVRGCYEWIKDLDYIRFADRVEDITTEYKKIPEGVHTYDNSHLKHYYQELLEDIFTILHWS